MDTVFKNFEETIQTALEKGEFPDAAKLIVRGKLEYAMERGDLSVKQAWELEALMGDEFNQRYARAFEIASFGEVYGDALPATVPPVPV